MVLHVEKKTSKNGGTRQVPEIYLIYCHAKAKSAPTPAMRTYRIPNTDTGKKMLLRGPLNRCVHSRVKTKPKRQPTMYMRRLPYD